MLIPPITDRPFNALTGGPLEYIQTEVFINPPSMMYAEINNLEDPTVNCFRLGHILMDDAEGTVAKICKHAKETFAKGKPDCSTWSDDTKSRKRYHLCDQLHDAWDAIEAGDAAMGALMLMKGLSSTLDVLYESRGWWGVKEKRRMRDLACKREAGDETAKKVLYLAKRIARGDLESVERFKSLRELVNLVLAPLGGPMTYWGHFSICAKETRFWIRLSVMMSTVTNRPASSLGTLNSQGTMKPQDASSDELSMNRAATKRIMKNFSQNGAALQSAPLLLLKPLNDSFQSKKLDLIEPVKVGRKMNVKNGPEPNNGIFDSKVLSRNHAEIWYENGKVWIKDVKSSNGTFVNGLRLSEEGQMSAPHELNTNDVLEFGIDIMNDDGKTIMYHKVSCIVNLWESSEMPPNYTITRENDSRSSMDKVTGMKLESVISLLDDEIKKASSTSAELQQLKSTLADLDALVVGSGVRSGPTKPLESEVGAPGSVTKNASKNNANLLPDPAVAANAEPTVSVKAATAATEAAVKEAVDALKVEKDKEIESLRQQLDETMKMLKEKDAKIKAALIEGEEKGKKVGQEEVKKVKTQMEGQIAKVKEEVETWKAASTKAESALDDLKKKESTALKASAAATQAQKEHLESLESEIKSLKEENDTLRTLSDELQSQVSSLQAELDTLKSQDETTRSILDEAVQNAAVSKAQVEALKSEKKSLEDKIVGLENQVEKYDSLLKEAQRKPVLSRGPSIVSEEEPKVESPKSGLRKRKSTAGRKSVASDVQAEEDEVVDEDLDQEVQKKETETRKGSAVGTIAVQALMYFSFMGMAALGVYAAYA
ncbi:hypothetical protein HDV05_003659, partial [Chytridiales sp. JEL 0842]